MSNHEITVKVVFDDEIAKELDIDTPDEWNSIHDLAGAFAAGVADGEITGYSSLDVKAADIVREAKERNRG